MFHRIIPEFMCQVGFTVEIVPEGSEMLPTFSVDKLCVCYRGEISPSTMAQEGDLYMEKRSEMKILN